MSESVTQVVIVGGGPVGLGLALELDRHGIRCIVVERTRQIHRIPKGQNLTQRTLEHCQFWNVVDELRAARPIPRDYPIGDIVCYRTLNSRWWTAAPGREVVRAYYSQANERLPQYELERVLRAAVARAPNVETLYGWNATDLRQDPDSVQVAIQDTAGERRSVRADYCVGCDGGRSIVRERVGIKRSGIDFDTRMALVVFRSRELQERLRHFPERSTYTVLKPELNGYWQFFGRIDAGEAWFFHAPVPTDADDSFDFEGLLHEAAGFRFGCTIDYVGFWDLRLSVAESYRAGRAFIAGDAAHTHPPYGGFGVNNGFEDAANIGWKLAAVLQGWGGEALLDSYSFERQPVFKETGEDFIAGNVRAGAEFLQRYSPERDLSEFEAAWARRSGDGMRAFEYEPNYEGSAVIAGPKDGRTSAHGTHMFKARPGHHLAPAPMADGRSNFDALGVDFTLLAFGDIADDAASFVAAAKELGIPLKVLRDTHKPARDAYEADLVLVRPDQYVVWAGAQAPADVASLLAKAAGR